MTEQAEIKQPAGSDGLEAQPQLTASDNLNESLPLEAVLEAILFAAGYPIEFEKLAAAATASEGTVRECVWRMKQQYQDARRGIQMVIYEDKCQLCTKEPFEKQIRLAMGIKQNGKLSNSCLEVLAVIAYHQPVTKAVVEQIRGVDSSYAISVLGEKSLIEAKGRLDVPGKPILYGTTDDFLRVFGLSSLDELPAVGDTPEQTNLNLESV